MEAWFNTTFENALAFVISTIGIYAAVIIFTRIFGKRSFSKMSSFDFFHDRSHRFYYRYHLTF